MLSTTLFLKGEKISQGCGNRGVRGQMPPHLGNLPGGKTWYFDPQKIRKEIFSGTHPHGIDIIIVLYSETGSRTVFFWLSFQQICGLLEMRPS